MHTNTTIYRNWTQHLRKKIFSPILQKYKSLKRIDKKKVYAVIAEYRVRTRGGARVHQSRSSAVLLVAVMLTDIWARGSVGPTYQ